MATKAQLQAMNDAAVNAQRLNKIDAGILAALPDDETDYPLHSWLAGAGGTYHCFFRIPAGLVAVDVTEAERQQYHL